MKSKSIRYTPDGEIELVEETVAEPGFGEVQVEGLMCGICSWDVATCKLGRDMPFPAPPGHEGLGYVTKLGEGVTRVKVGDRVACGGFGKLSNQPIDKVHVIPDSDISDEHWLVEPVSCVVTAMDTANIRTGDRVAVIGCGFMGMILLQMLTHAPVSLLSALDINRTRLDVVHGFGVADLYDLSEGDPDARLEHLKAQNYEIVFDTSGSQAGLDLATQIVCYGGQINLFGWIKGTQANFDPTLWHTKGIRVINSSPAAQQRDPFPAAIRSIASGNVDLKPMVSHVVPLDGYPALMKQILAGDAAYIKGVVKL